MRVKTLTILTTGLVVLLALPAWAQDTKDMSSPWTDVPSPAGLTREEMFDDVPASSLFCPWIEELARRGITGGCVGGNYCPAAPVTRAQMAAFLVKAQFPTNVPLGVTVTGRWGFDVHTDGSGDWGTSISYPAPMPATLAVRYIEFGSGTEACPGTLDLPAAVPGFLCVYERNGVNETFNSSYGNSPFGSTIYFVPGGSGDMYADGTWAATAHLDLTLE